MAATNSIELLNAPKTSKKSGVSSNGFVRKAASPASVIIAHVDVGFGNTLYLRGDGPGLSWERGVPFECKSNDEWTISIANVAKPFVFKILINDEIWCTGEDYQFVPGKTLKITPIF